MLAVKNNETFIDFGNDKNATFVLKRGAAGTVLQFKCLDDKKLPASLKNCTVTISAQILGGGGDTKFVDAACEIDANQFDNPGIGKYTFDGQTSDLIAGDYRLEIKVVDKKGTPRFYPNNRMTGFARLVVHDSISSIETRNFSTGDNTQS